jgi:hypothetical protein
MNSTFLGVLRDAGEGVITHIGLVDASGDELSSASYARQAVTWTDDGTNMRPSADLEFDTTSGDVVAGWRGYSASTAGTDYGGAALTETTFSNDGTYTLLAASTSINIAAS